MHIITTTWVHKTFQKTSIIIRRHPIDSNSDSSQNKKTPYNYKRLLTPHTPTIYAPIRGCKLLLVGVRCLSLHHLVIYVCLYLC